MIEIIIGTAAAGSAIGALITRALYGPRRRKPKYPCPWEPCGYPLPETPLISKLETKTHYADTVAEDCPGCGKTVRWCVYANEEDGGYVRFKAPEPSKVEPAAS